MRRQVWIAAIVVALLGGGRKLTAEPPCCPPQDDFLSRLAPAGGWFPDGGGLFHWWPRCCFPRRGAPDDYCRKPLPKVCWPPYPPYYIFGAPERCSCQNRCVPMCSQSH